MADHTVTSPANATPMDTQHLDDVLPSLVELFEPTSHSMCEFGDIMLAIEDEYHPQLRLKVNSCILASASKVFKTLLRGCFAEGVAIQSGTREVYMNDNPAPMLAMCQLLHLKPLEPAVDQGAILDFALLVDKFDCIQPLKYATDSILGQFTTSSHDAPHDLAASAYILDHPRHFRRVTKATVRRNATDYLPELEFQYQDQNTEHLPTSFMSSIIHQKNVVRNELVRCITGILDKFATAAHYYHRPDLIYQIMEDMKREDLWPIKPTYPSGIMRPLEEQLTSLLSLRLPILNAEQDKSYETPLRRINSFRSGRSNLGEWGYNSMPATPCVARPPVHGFTTSTPQTLTVHAVLELSKLLDDLCVGLCLECLKGNGICRTPHPDPWSAYRNAVRYHFGPDARGDNSELDSGGTSWHFADLDPHEGW